MLNILRATSMTHDELADRLRKEYGSDRASIIMSIFLSIHRNDSFEKAGMTPDEIAQVQNALDDALQALCPKPCASIVPEFWDTHAGQLIAEVQFWLWGDDYIQKAEAARIIYGDVPQRALMNNINNLITHGDLQVYRRPDREMNYPRRPSKRTTENASPRSWLLRKSDVENFAAKRSAKR